MPHSPIQCALGLARWLTTRVRSVVHHVKPAQPGDVPITFADLRKSKQLLGYDPQVRCLFS